MATEKGKRLAALIREKGLQNKTLAAGIGVAPATISRYINGHQELSSKHLRTAAIILGVSTEYLRCETDERGQPENINPEMIVSNNQTKLFNEIGLVFHDLGLKIDRYLKIADCEYQGVDYGWARIDNAIEAIGTADYLNQKEYVEEIYKHPGESSISYQLEYSGKRKHISLEEYNSVFLKNYLSLTKAYFNAYFGLNEKTDSEIVDGVEERALKGLPPLTWLE